jgi:hypothetical protein
MKHYSSATKFLGSRYASPKDANVSNGVLREISTLFAATTDIVANDICFLAVIPASARVKSVSFANDAVTAFTGSIDVYRKDGMVKVGTLKASQSFASAVAAPAVAYQPTVANTEADLAAVCGVQAAAGEDFVLAITAAAAPTAAGNVATVIDFVSVS